MGSSEPRTPRATSAAATDADTRGTLGTVRNAMLLLELLSDGPAFRQLSELAEDSGLSLPTVHRLLRSLVLANVVEQDPRSSRYGLGPEVVRLSQRYLARLPVLGALSPYLLSLRDQVPATIQVAVLVGGTVVGVDRVDAADAGPFRAPPSLPGAFESAAGRLLVSRASNDAWETATLLSPPATVELAERSREAWSAADHLVHDDEVAVPVFDGSGSAVAALCAAPSQSLADLDIEAVIKRLRSVASAAGRTLGHG